MIVKYTKLLGLFPYIQFILMMHSLSFAKLLYLESTCGSSKITIWLNQALIYNNNNTWLLSHLAKKLPMLLMNKGSSDLNVHCYFLVRLRPKWNRKDRSWNFSSCQWHEWILCSNWWQFSNTRKHAYFQFFLHAYRWLQTWCTSNLY